MPVLRARTKKAVIRRVRRFSFLSSLPHSIGISCHLLRTMRLDWYMCERFERDSESHVCPL